MVIAILIAAMSFGFHSVLVLGNRLFFFFFLKNEILAAVREFVSFTPNFLELPFFRLTSEDQALEQVPLWKGYFSKSFHTVDLFVLRCPFEKGVQFLILCPKFDCIRCPFSYAGCSHVLNELWSLV